MFSKLKVPITGNKAGINPALREGQSHEKIDVYGG